MQLQKLWYDSYIVVWLLWPLSIVFGAITALRRWMYKNGMKKSVKPNAFVIVVGNISVGGNGKTPVVISIVEHLKKKGVRVGVLSRGYGGTQTHFPHRVSIKNTAALVGDEPSLIANRTNVPVVIDPVRTRGADSLINDYHCTVIVCDDGLQHYKMQRDLELVVMDGRGIGNGHLMPMGPLRETPERLGAVDGIVLNSRDSKPSVLTSITVPVFPMSLAGNWLVNVLQPSIRKPLAVFAQNSVTAIAGIGHPDRFFDQLRDSGLTLAETKAFPDHHHYTASDVTKRCVLMTEKDAVKIRPYAHSDCWYLPVDADLPAPFFMLIESRLNKAGIAV